MADPTRMKLEEYLRHWLAGATHLAPKTHERYAELCGRQIYPHLGDTKLTALRAEHIVSWHRALLSAGLSAQTIVHAHRVLSLALSRAVKLNTLARNYASLVKPPRIEERELEILTPEEAAALVRGLEGHWLHPIAVVALATGLRRGELCGLKWQDINFNGGFLRVERSVEETRQGLRLKPPKTKRGRRNITLTADAVKVLRAHLTWQKTTRLKIGAGGQPVFVFSTLEGEMLSPDNLSRDWRRICRAKKLPLISLHGLRHCHASFALKARVDILTLSRRLGHYKASVTLDRYGHLVEGSDAEAAAAIEGVLKK